MPKSATPKAMTAESEAPRSKSRERLLASAVSAFEGGCYEEVSVAQIAAAAGVATGLLYHYLPSKRDLYIAAMRVGIDPQTVPRRPWRPMRRRRDGPTSSWCHGPPWHRPATQADPRAGRPPGDQEEVAERLTRSATSRAALVHVGNPGARHDAPGRRVVHPDAVHPLPTSQRHGWGYTIAEARQEGDQSSPSRDRNTL